MFKDYYLLLGVKRDASAQEIKNAFKDAESKNNINGIVPKEFYDIQEAFEILSDQNIKELYDKELVAFDNSEDKDYKIKNGVLSNKINALQYNLSKYGKTSPGWESKIGKGCMWIFALIIILMLQICVSAVLKQKRKNALRNHYSYVASPEQSVNNNNCGKDFVIYLCHHSIKRININYQS